VGEPVRPETIPVVQAEFAETATIETPVYSLVVSNQGAVIQSIRLRDFASDGDQTMELVDASIAGEVGWPLELVTNDEAVNEALENGLWALEANNTEVSMELAGGGLRAFKELRFDPSSYYFTFTAGVEQDGRALPFSVVWQGSFGDQSTEYAPELVNVVYMEGAEFDRLNVGSIEDPQLMPATQFLGVEDQYFLAMFSSTSIEQPVVRSLVHQAAPEEDPIVLPRIELPYASELEVYVGPKQQVHLDALNPALASVIEYGWFGFIGKPLLDFLLYIDGYIGNFGWSIIVMTVLINVLLFPLRLKQQLSMAKMQKIQPQMRTLQDKYKKLKPNDARRQEVQSEMMGLYQKNGVNPLGGCLPLLLQMPIFFAIFQLLRSAIELRGAPWVLWVQDLSLPDPYYVLPVLMGISMMASQKLMPTAMDPAQARIMMLMPIMFLAFMLWQQSGLVLYWLTSNVVGVGQQVLINRVWVPKTKKEPSPEVIEVSATEVEEIPDSDTDTDPDAASEPRKRRRKKKR
jgi:YidC/Oxa1 family membrane protein insertase